MRVLPLADDEKAAWIGEQRVDVVEDHEIEVEEQRHAVEAAEVFLHQAELGPILAQLGIVVELGQRLAFDTGPDPGRIVGEAYEADRPRRMPHDHCVEPVDEYRRIAVAPFHANDIDPSRSLRLGKPGLPSRFASHPSTGHISPRNRPPTHVAKSARRRVIWVSTPVRTADRHIR